jgi:uncharacterized protein
MSIDLLQSIQTNLASPPPLFFLLGVFAVLVKSDLKFPEELYTGMTLYLLVAIGLKGGTALSEANLVEIWKPAIAAVVGGSLIPLWLYPILRFMGGLPKADSAAIAAHYGSVSAMTFIAATNFLQLSHQTYEPYSVAFLALMEAPAILVSIFLSKFGRSSSESGTTLRKVFHDALFGKSVLLLLGSLIIGCLCGKRGLEASSGFFVAPFQGVLSLFLLEMGIVAGRRLEGLRRIGAFLISFGILVPVAHGLIGAWIGQLVGLSIGGATLFSVLFASASYIAAPATVRLAIPDANPAYYLTSSLAITFPWNVTFGIPLYHFFTLWIYKISS